MAVLLAINLLLGTIAAASEIAVVVSGKYHDPIIDYQVGSFHYLNAKEAGSIYGGQVYWYPVSGRVQMSFRGRLVNFLVGSSAVKMGDRAVTLERPVLLRASNAYVPLSFFLSEDFSDWAGRDSVFNPRTSLLTVDKRASVGPPRWFSYGDRTRLVVELGTGLAYSATRRGLRGLEVVVPLGIIEASEKASIQDGIVEAFSLKQGAKAAHLALQFARPGMNWRLRILPGPRRLVVDVFSPDAVIDEEEIKDGEDAVLVAPPPAVKAGKPAAPEPMRSSGPQVFADKTSPRRRRIVVDAGHGGKDSGAAGLRGSLEKEINLLAARELAKLLHEEGRFEVLLTRADDVFIPLADRSRIANEFEADIFISLHCNASLKYADSGFEVYFLSEKASDPEAEKVAQFENAVLELEDKIPDSAMMILGELTKTENINAASELAGLMARALPQRVDLENRGVKQAAFFVLRGTRAPAVLFEMAFITNKKDEVQLQSARFRRRLVDGIYAGILEYAKRQNWISPTL